jgi:hypothetical protein
MELNCLIFRCGIFKDTLHQLDPHLCKEECDRLFKEGKIYGCGKPFRVEETNAAAIPPTPQQQYIAKKCDYD